MGLLKKIELANNFSSVERILGKYVLENGEKVQLIGFGTFETRERAAREGRNPRTKETITIPASTVPVFKAGKEFKDRVNK